METEAGTPLTKEEIKLIKSLEVLSKRWEKHGERLWLFSASGSLHVMMYAGDKNPFSNKEESTTNKGGVNPENMITTINIPNDGGDW